MTEKRSNRWQLLRDLAVFQLKLLVDGFRDLVMSPVSLIAALVGLLTRGRDPAGPFREVLALGKQTERWINLFGGLSSGSTPRGQDDAGMDRIVQQLESKLVEQYEKGGITASAKSSIDKSVDSLQQRLKTAQESLLRKQGGKRRRKKR